MLKNFIAPRWWQRFPGLIKQSVAYLSKLLFNLVCYFPNTRTSHLPSLVIEAFLYLFIINSVRWKVCPKEANIQGT